MAARDIYRRGIRTAAGAALLAAALCAPGAAQTADEVLERVRGRYEEIRDARISFTRKSGVARTRVEQTEQGTLTLKKKNRFRVEMVDHTIVTDGETVWSYSRQAHQVLVDRFREEEGGFTPERVLAGAPGDYTATLLDRDTVAGREAVGVKLTPRGEPGGALRLWVDPRTWLIRRASLDQGSGQETVYTVTDIRTNTGIPDTRFSYDIPEGADVVDLR